MAESPRAEHAHPSNGSTDQSTARKVPAPLLHPDQLLHLFHTAPAFVTVHQGPEHVYVFSNEAASQALAPIDPLGLPLRQVVPWLAGQNFFERFDRVYATGEPLRIDELRITVDRPENGDVVEGFINQVLQPWHGDDGAIMGVISLGFDVTEQVRARRALQSSRERLDLALAAARLGTFEVDLDTERVQCGRRAQEILALPADLSLDQFLQRVHPSDRSTLRQAIEQLHRSRSTQPIDIVFQITEHDTGDDNAALNLSALHRSARHISCSMRRIASSGESTVVLGAVQDITQRRTDEAALQDARLQIAAALSAGSIATWAWDIARDQVYADDNLRRWFAIADEEEADLPSERLLRVVHAADFQRVREALDRALEQGGDFSIDCRLMLVGRHVRWIEARGRIEQTPEGVPMRAVGILQDITDRKQAEEALQQNQEHLQQALGAANLGTWRHDVSLNLIHFDRRARTILGLQKETLGHDEMLRRIHPDDLSDYRRRRIQALDPSSPSAFEEIHRVLLPDGIVRWVRSHANVFAYDENQRTLQAVGVMADVTDEVEAEEALRESEARFRALFSAIDEGFCLCQILVDPRGEPFDYRFLEVNPLFEEMTGLVDPVGRTALELVPDLEQHWVETYARVALERKAIRFQNGSDAMGRWFDVFATPVEPYGRFALVFKDISQRKQAEDELRRSREELQSLNATLEQRVQQRTQQLEQSNRELEQFAYIASHDLKAPLRGIESLLYLIEDDEETQLSPNSQRYAATMRGRVQRLQTFLNDLLLYSRIGRKRYQTSRVDVGALVAELWDLLSPPNTMRLFIESELPALNTERVPLEMVLRNLMSNAIKHSREDGCVWISADSTPSGHRFTVRDNGPGIEPIYHQRIFEMFQTLRPRDQVEGSGMGLAIVKKIVGSRGDSITVESDVDQGATFRFTWSTGEEA